MDVDKRAERLAQNTLDMDYAMQRMMCWMRKLEKLAKERKRLLYPNGRPKAGPLKLTIEQIRQRALIGGSDFNDDIPS